MNGRHRPFTGRISRILSVMTLLFLTGNTGVTVITGAELRKLITGSSVTNGSSRTEIEQFSEDGRYRHLFLTMSEQGTYSFEGNLLCTLSPNKKCKQVVRDKHGKLYYIFKSDKLSQKWPINVERLKREM